MKFFNILIVTCALVGSTAFADDSNFQECLQKDSISCIQMMVFRRAKSLFEQPSIEIFGGVSLVKAPSSEVEGKSLSDASGNVEAAESVEQREGALESFVFENARNFFAERSLKLNVVNVARSLSNAIPDEVKANIRDLVVEGRGKKKKILKKLLPILGLIKLKLVGLALIALFGIGLIAKKAILVSVLSLLISGFIAIKTLLAKKLGIGKLAAEHIEAIPFQGGGGWGAGGVGGGWNSYDPHGFGEYAAHSQPVAQSVAYSGHKASRR
jgi:hypothetical protein